MSLGILQEERPTGLLSASKRACASATLPLVST
jgi:hypothetical protein